MMSSSRPRGTRRPLPNGGAVQPKKKPKTSAIKAQDIDTYTTDSTNTTTTTKHEPSLQSKPTTSTTSSLTSSSSTSPSTSSGGTGLPLPSLVGVRQDIRLFFYPNPNDTGALQRRDLFILGFQRWMSLPKEDIHSYLQIASIHGRPMSVGYGVDAPLTETDLELETEDEQKHAPTPLTKMKYVDRDGDGPQFSNMGVSEFAYCKHGRPTFMTWHRPYMYLAERAIRQSAKYLIDNKLIRGDLTGAAAQVGLLRMPYWNWGVNAPVPDVIMCDTIELTQFSLDGQGLSSISSDDSIVNHKAHRTVIPNPFKAFCPTPQQYEYFNGEVPLPGMYQAPQGVPGTLTDYDQNCVFGPSGTLRQDGWSNYLYRFLMKELRNNLSEAFQQDDFIAKDLALNKSGSHWLEASHNALHNSFSMALAPQFGLPVATSAPATSHTTGTPQSHPVSTVQGRSAMINDMSTMDPAFWFHHSFVDCQLAMHRHAFPNGNYLPNSIEPPLKWNKKECYPYKDPVPADTDMQVGETRDWLKSSLHPWSYGLFTELYEGADPLDKERQQIRQRGLNLQTPHDEKDSTTHKKRNDKTNYYQLHYVNSDDVEDCKKWGYTYDILLTKELIDRRVVQLASDGPGWLTAEQAQEKFILDFTEDPFLKLVHRGMVDYKLGSPPWELQRIPLELLTKMHQAATNKTWKVTMDLPKFFKIDNNMGVGRSYTVNLYLLNKENMLPEQVNELNLNPTSPLFAGSASVFAPFNLRECLNCQKGSMIWPVSVDITDIVIECGLTSLSPSQILARLWLEPVGIPLEFLPPAEMRKHVWCTKVNDGQLTEPTGKPDTVQQVLWKWKKSFTNDVEKSKESKTNDMDVDMSSTRSLARVDMFASSPSPSTSISSFAGKSWRFEHKDQLTKLMELFAERHLPSHEHSLFDPQTNAHEATTTQHQP